MGELAQAMQLFHRGFSTAILRYPTGKYGIAGSVPGALTRERPSLTPPGTQRVSMVWETEQEVIDALLSIGIMHFQRADCSWYDKA